jgi:hypothetical protein
MNNYDEITEIQVLEEQIELYKEKIRELEAAIREGSKGQDLENCLESIANHERLIKKSEERLEELKENNND